MYKIVYLIVILLFPINLFGANEIKIIAEQSFLSENRSTEREAIVNFLVNQFNDYNNQVVTQSNIDEFWNKRGGFRRFQIIDQKLYADTVNNENFRFKCFLDFFNSLLNKYKIENVDFILFAEDGHHEKFEAPYFVMSKDSIDQRHLLLLPDQYMIDNWDSLAIKILDANQNNLWSEKENKIFWRGATTGGLYSTININKIPRLSLVLLSALYPDLIDARFINYAQFLEGKDGDDLLQILNMLKLIVTDNTPEVNHLKYKYLISLDGNTCAWKRVPWIMRSNSVLVKQETSKMEWFYPALKPYVHYVPVKEDLTDIFQQLDWMKSHDTEVQQISQNAQNFVQNNLMPEDIEAHTVIILNEYSKLFKGEKIVPTLPSAEESLAKLDQKKEQEIENNLPRKKKISRFFNNLKEKVKSLWY